MTDTTPRPDSAPAAYEPALTDRIGMPRWVRVSLIVAAALVALFLVANLTGLGSEHGPGRHGGGNTPTSADSDGGSHPRGNHGP